MYIERCRNSLFKTMCKSGIYAHDAIRSIEFFEEQYKDLSVKDYIIKMGNIQISYILNSDLSKEDRMIYTDGMDFADTAIGDITNNDLLLVSENMQLEYISNVFEKKKKNGIISYNDHEEEVFKLGILASCMYNFNLVDTLNIIDNKTR